MIGPQSPSPRTLLVLALAAVFLAPCPVCGFSIKLAAFPQREGNHPREEAQCHHSRQRRVISAAAITMKKTVSDTERYKIAASLPGTVLPAPAGAECVGLNPRHAPCSFFGMESFKSLLHSAFQAASSWRASIQAVQIEPGGSKPTRNRSWVRIACA